MRHPLSRPPARARQRRPPLTDWSKRLVRCHFGSRVQSLGVFGSALFTFDAFLERAASALRRHRRSNACGPLRERESACNCGLVDVTATRGCLPGLRGGGLALSPRGGAARRRTSGVRALGSLRFERLGCWDAAAGMLPRCLLCSHPLSAAERR